MHLGGEEDGYPFDVLVKLIGTKQRFWSQWFRARRIEAEGPDIYETCAENPGLVGTRRT